MSYEVVNKVIERIKVRHRSVNKVVIANSTFIHPLKYVNLHFNIKIVSNKTLGRFENLDIESRKSLSRHNLYLLCT